MKKNIAIIALGVVSLIALPSCSTNTTAPSAPTTATVAPNPQAAIKAGGSSSTVDFLRTMTAAYEARAKTGQITLLEPGQSENIVAGVKQGLIDIGVLSKSLKPEDLGSGLESREVARDALLVATHPSVTGVKNLTTANLKAIYSGSVTNWRQLGGPDAEIVVLDRPEDESAKRLLRKHYLGKELQNAPNAVVLRKEGELIQTIQSTPYSIGAFSLAHAISHNLPVNRLSLNNIAPTPENMKTGQYPMYRTITIVWNKKASQATQSFISYISGEPGIAVLEQAGFAAISPITGSQNQ
ncbi:phosphate ABC transporter substrate-binding protein [Leptolyngbya sp. 'hensonii']|uniref:substrate-binding domain-containing protein n=1 Tax=Leptolyngbya sp. 'hensonii' TaxID=1922337 RepID=UPI00094F8E87|nr:substrate-binding domain-containing protein [Leptolyngbya sp. 'hensonii']OLP18887.1 phosphate ABC transporter substrate-binding protein [Leptolyngbya sp. 'hensonii']